MAQETPSPEATNPKTTLDYWLKFVRAAKKAAIKRHWIDASEAWREFEKDEEEEVKADTKTSAKVYPAYNSAVNTISPALYARTPELTTEREFEIEDDIANTACLMAERLSDYLVRNSNFDDVMGLVVGDLIHAAKATNQLIYEVSITKVRTSLIPSGNDFLLADGTIHEGEVQQDTATGEYFTMMDGPDEDSQKIYLAPTPFDEIVHTPNAKTFNDITEMCYYFVFTKEEATQKFSPEVIANYPWKKGSPTAGRSSDVDDVDRIMQDAPDFYMDGWECYCKDTKSVYWISENYKEGFLKDPEKDPYGLVGFFPSPPFIMMNRPRKNLYPRPAYIHLRPTLNQLHLMYARVFGLIDSVRRRAIVDGAEDVVNILNAGDQEFVSIASVRSLIEKVGDLEKLIWYVPVQELVAAIGELNTQQSVFEDHIEKWIGTPDIMQGVSDPIEAMGTQEIKASAAQDRFKVIKKSVQQLARNSIQMMLDLALKVFSDKKIARITGLQYMPEENQNNFGAALQLLRDDKERTIRIDIETDSLTFVDQGLKAQRRNLAIQSALAGLEKANAMMEINPQQGALAFRATLLSLEGLDDGKKFQDELKQIRDASIKAAEEAAANPPKPPPDYEGQKLQILAREVAVKEGQLQLDMQLRTVDQQLKGQIAQMDFTINSQKVEIEGLKVQNKQQIDATKAELDAAKITLNQGLEKAWLALEKEKADRGALSDLLAQVSQKNEQHIQKMQLMHDRVAHVETLAHTAIAGGDSESSEGEGVSSHAPKKNQPQNNMPVIHIHNGGDEEVTMERTASGFKGTKRKLKASVKE